MTPACIACGVAYGLTVVFAWDALCHQRAHAHCRGSAPEGEEGDPFDWMMSDNPMPPSGGGVGGQAADESHPGAASSIGSKDIMSDGGSQASSAADPAPPQPPAARTLRQPVPLR